MSLSTNDIANLLFRSLEGELPERDRQALQEWLGASAHHRALYDDLHHEDRLREQLLSFRPEEQAATSARILNQVNAGVFADGALEADVTRERVRKPVARVHFLKMTWFRYAAAIIIVLGIGPYLWINNTNRHQPALTTTQPAPNEKDILPGTSKAILTLSDGRKIELDDAQAGTYIEDGDAGITKGPGSLTYKGGHTPGINTMATPNGGQYKLQLADGTKVWLNAASSIIYPTAFTKSTREVTITGEAYLEVKKNASKPFIVRTSSDIIEVLGTEFNINAYADEVAVRTTLISGSVNVNHTNIQPGQAYQQGKVIPANASQATEWKNGRFDFNDLDVKSAMRQISRWYDVKIVYEAEVPKFKLGGMLGRDLNLSQVLRSLSSIGVKTILNGNTITVLSAK